MACSSWARRIAEIGILRLGGFELRFGLRDSFIGGDAGIELELRQIERILVGHDGGVKKLLQGVLRAKIVIVDRDLHLRGEPHIFEVRRAGLCTIGVGVYGIAHAAPEIGHPGGVKRQGIIGEGHNLRGLDGEAAQNGLPLVGDGRRVETVG